MDQIVKIKQDAHWYDREGNPCHEVLKADGKGYTKTTLVHARKLFLLPSVTTKLKVLAKPQLVRWQIEQGILAALTLPRNDGESLDDFARRVALDGAEQTEKAADLGKQIHSTCELWAKSSIATEDETLRPFQNGFRRFIEDNKIEILESEVVRMDDSTAGTLDLKVLWDGNPFVIDIKSQDCKKDRHGRVVFNFYDDWLYQVSKYADMDRRRCGSEVFGAILLFDKTRPGEFDFKRFTPQELKCGLNVFESASLAWENINQFYPRLCARSKNGEYFWLYEQSKERRTA